MTAAELPRKRVFWAIADHASYPRAEIGRMVITAQDELAAWANGRWAMREALRERFAEADYTMRIELAERY